VWITTQTPTVGWSIATDKFEGDDQKQSDKTKLIDLLVEKEQDENNLSKLLKYLLVNCVSFEETFSRALIIAQRLDGENFGKKFFAATLVASETFKRGLEKWMNEQNLSESDGWLFRVRKKVKDGRSFNKALDDIMWNY